MPCPSLTSGKRRSPRDASTCLRQRSGAHPRDQLVSPRGRVGQTLPLTGAELDDAIGRLVRQSALVVEPAKVNRGEAAGGLFGATRVPNGGASDLGELVPEIGPERGIETHRDPGALQIARQFVHKRPGLAGEQVVREIADRRLL